MNQEDAQKLQEMEVVKKNILKKMLTKDAIERLGRIKLVKPDMANQLELYLVQLYQAGKIPAVIDDNHLKMILEEVSQKTKFRIIK